MRDYYINISLILRLRARIAAENANRSLFDKENARNCKNHVYGNRYLDRIAGNSFQRAVINLAHARYLTETSNGDADLFEKLD